MKLIKISLFASLLAGGMLSLSSCTKSFDSKITTNDDFSNSSLVRVFIATVNANRNYIYVDGKPVNGSALVSGSIFPASGIYGAAISPGLKAFEVKDTLRTSTQAPLTFAENMQVNRYYTIFTYDTITSPKQKTVLTNLVVPADTTVRLRFANFIYNPTAVPAIDVFSYYKNANIFTNIPVTEVTDFIAYPSRIPIDTLYIRETGSSVNILKVPFSVLTEKRSYTLVYRGSHRGTRIATTFADR